MRIADLTERAHVAAAVRRVTVVQASGAGTCIYRACAGRLALAVIGIKARLVTGSMVYRCGPGADDVLLQAYHAWLEADGQLIDFSCGDWRREASRARRPVITAIGVSMDAPVPAMTWTVEPPAYIWQRAKPLRRAWRPLPATPALGEAWYGPALGDPMGMASLAAAEKVIDQHVLPRLLADLAPLMRAAVW